MHRDDPNSATAFLYSVMHNRELPISDRVKAAAALMEVECAQPRSRRKGRKLVEPPPVVIRIPSLPSAAFARAEERQRVKLTLLKGHG
jgi:hypothetical protein